MCFGAAATQPFSLACRRWPSEGRASERRPWTRARARAAEVLVLDASPSSLGLVVGVVVLDLGGVALPPARAGTQTRGLPHDGAGALGQPVAALPALLQAAVADAAMPHLHGQARMPVQGPQSKQRAVVARGAVDVVDDGRALGVLQPWLQGQPFERWEPHFAQT